MQSSTPTTTTWTILALMEWGAKYLTDRGFEDARLNIELLLSHILDLPRIHLYSNFDRPLGASELAGFKAALQRRRSHEPLQYIIGETEFMGIPLYVNPSVLIPRPETEELVQRAADWINTLGAGPVQVLDIGTGSANIPIALERFSATARITSIDVSAEALAVAARNVERHQCTRIILHQRDVFERIFPEQQFDVIVANPPYISVAEFALLPPEVREFEPSIATTDNADGLRFVRRICDIATERLRDGGVLLMEVAYNQGAVARQIAADAGLVDVEVFTDFAGNERMLQGRQVA